MNEKPNSVIFRVQDKLCLVKINESGKGEWETVYVIDTTTMLDSFSDISSENPFEFVFCHYKDDVLKSSGQKTVVPNHSFETLYANNHLENTIEGDFKTQYLITL
jgi:hypothetical protein